MQSELSVRRLGVGSQVALPPGVSVLGKDTETRSADSFVCEWDNGLILMDALHSSTCHQCKYGVNLHLQVVRRLQKC